MMEPRQERRWDEVDGSRLHARVWRVTGSRDAPTVVLVHGLVSSRYFVPVAERLADWCHVLAPDLPGFGQSPRQPGPPTVASLAKALAGWMTAAAVGPAVVLGHSNGAQVAAELAARSPAHVTQLVLASPTGDPHAGLGSYARRWFRNLPREPLSLNKVIAREMVDAGVRPIRAFLHALRHPFIDVLPVIQVPTLVLRGGREPIATAAWAERVAALVPGGRLDTVPGAPHTYGFAAPGPLSDVLRRNLLGRT
jgi:pimeloyl-ACP methyl ester carboxylesterase